jgi:hypothetical protein
MAKVPRWLGGKLHTVSVPAAQEAPLVRPPLYRIRALKRHLIASLRDLREAKRPERLIQARTAQPLGFAADVVRAGCATCQGHCCRGGGEHAYLDERTMARVRRDNPDLDAAGVIALYVGALAETAYEGSCLFHGRKGCTLPKPLRAELCNTYYCNGLWDFLKLRPLPAVVEVVASKNGVARRSVVKAVAGEDHAGWD